uniref:Uncharacterized protein n=1 Tax=Anguilla anguilla TaxID=7936 RepID=A0A0E9T2Y1_ANGAN
MPSKFGSSAR